MANYIGTMRTNYFRVRDEEAFRKLMSTSVDYEGCPLQLFEKEEDGRKLFGFGGYGGLLGICDPDNDDFEWNEAREAFIETLKDLLEDGNAAIILEAGAEKMRYVTGIAEIVTKTGSDFVDMTAAAKEKARALLGNPKWDTCCEY